MYTLLGVFLQVRWDFTINVGTLITICVFLVGAIAAWLDLTWRIKNLETWRTEHMVDSDSRDKLQGAMGKILDRLGWVEEHRRTLAPWNGEERRNP